MIKLKVGFWNFSGYGKKGKERKESPNRRRDTDRGEEGSQVQTGEEFEREG